MQFQFIFWLSIVVVIRESLKGNNPFMTVVVEGVVEGVVVEERRYGMRPVVGTWVVEELSRYGVSPVDDWEELGVEEEVLVEVERR